MNNNNNIFRLDSNVNSFSSSFEGPLATISPDVQQFDLINTLETIRNNQLARLKNERDSFSCWLKNQTNNISLNEDMLAMLINCWLAAKEDIK